MSGKYLWTFFVAGLIVIMVPAMTWAQPRKGGPQGKGPSVGGNLQGKGPGGGPQQGRGPGGGGPQQGRGPGGGGPQQGRGPGGGGGNIMSDPGARFDWMAQQQGNKGYIDISKVQWNRERLEEYAKQKGISGGKISRDQYIEYSTQARKALEERSKQGGDSSSSKGNKGGRDSGRDNRNRGKSSSQDGITGMSTTIDHSILQERPFVARAGNLPSGMPQWFLDADQNEDGQVGLYEWKHTGKSLGEFDLYDRNGDGYVTPEEIIFFQTHMSDSPTAVAFNKKKEAEEEADESETATTEKSEEGDDDESTAKPEPAKKKANFASAPKKTEQPQTGGRGGWAGWGQQPAAGSNNQPAGQPTLGGFRFRRSILPGGQQGGDNNNAGGFRKKGGGGR